MSMREDIIYLFRGSPATRDRIRVRKPTAPDPLSGLINAAWITLFFAAFLFWPLLIVPFVLAIVLVARGRVGHGVSVMVLCIVLPFVAVAIGLGLLL